MCVCVIYFKHVSPHPNFQKRRLKGERGDFYLLYICKGMVFEERGGGVGRLAADLVQHRGQPKDAHPGEHVGGEGTAGEGPAGR